ncbi:tetratricopeptide repeat protein [Bradyrhizobium sp. 1]|uniref:tetratricopeptide repeat protein n=1 Tax=Bradyrhizobium sp. 1 TaxID=241591 RepID=UPI001FFC27C4|nr:tetratricopeptide repeat protein [Bradyrhizobium sp. 1]MCK1395769.1 tetratricopeptide repeat protein [Bradyrhizobium sp. 1]
MHPPTNHPQLLFQQAALAHDQGRTWEAERLYQAVLAADARHSGALLRLGMLRLDQRRLADAEPLFRRAAKADKRSAEAHQLLGFTLTGLGQLDEAVRAYEKAIVLRPGLAEAHNNLGYALQLLGRLSDAMARYRKAISLRPDYHEAHNNLGNAHHLQGQSGKAIPHYRRAIEINPGYAEACWNLGTALRATGQLDDAANAYARAIAIRPDYAEAHNSLGNTLRALGRAEDAVAQYGKALAIKPDYLEPHINLGDTLLGLNREDAAISSYDRALAIRPESADILCRRGDALARLRRDADATAGFEKALALDPEHDFAFDGLARTALASCDWTRTASLRTEVAARVAAGRFFDAFAFLSFSDNAELQLACARRYIRQHVPERPPPLWRGNNRRNDRIRIAYVASGFHDHPTAYLTAELIELHDRSRFEVIGISLGPDDGSDIRARLKTAFDQFHDVRDKSDREVAVLIKGLKVDIAVDRSGYTVNARPAIFAARPAPIQVNYIGFPGSLGADFYDYVIGDATVLPFDLQPFYSENIVHLPDCYLANDSRRPPAARAPTRDEAGLPPNGFVFCCFNNGYKITSDIFDVWMRLLEQVSGSVLWLYADRASAEANLRMEAAARGVDPARIVFARRVPQAEHLSRHHLADLFLDTLPYNAHTTAADALWAGLPVVTCPGKSFAGRVAASLLRAVGMPHLVTSDLGAYERLALRLALEPALLDSMRKRLQQNRLSQPLFHSDLYRRNLEAAYVTMWERWQRGDGPAGFAVTPDG